MLPHCTIEYESGADARRSFSLSRPIRVAFLGHTASHKGWNAFIDVVEKCANDNRYEFYHLGAGTKSLKRVTFEHASVAEDGPTAMLDKLKAAEIDVVLLWSIWPETFSFVVHEALAAGCAVITSKHSGNIASLLKNSRNGEVLDDEGALLRNFEEDSVCELAANRRRDVGSLRFGKMSLDVLFDDARDSK